MLHYHLYTIEPFDYRNGEIDGKLDSVFGDQLERAQLILKDRTNEEIEYGFESLDWLLREGGTHLWEEAMQIMKKDKRCVVNRVKALRALMPSIDLSEQEQLHKAKWSEYFALLAIAYVSESLHETKHAMGKELVPRMEYQAEQGNKYPYDWPIEAMDAVCFAEHLAALEEQDAEILKKAASARGQKGGNLRAQKYSKLKTLIIEEYTNKHLSRSNREAAKRIYKSNQGAIDNVLTTSEPNITIEKWIGAHKKGLS